MTRIGKILIWLFLLASMVPLVACVTGIPPEKVGHTRTLKDGLPWDARYGPGP
jgi:hypothetical protein